MSGTDLPARYTIGRVGSPKRAARHLGHDNDGRLVWTDSFVLSNTFETEADAESFRRNRMGDTAAAEVVRHTIH